MERKNILGVSLLGLTCLVGAQTASAEIALQPQAVPFGAFVLVPTLNAKTVFDDNIYSLSSNEVSSFSQVVNPNFAFVAQDRANVYKLVYNLNAAGYANDSDDSYNDHKIDLNAHIEPTARLRYDAGLAYGMLHDDRGTGMTSGVGLANILASGEVDKYDLATLRGGVEFGEKTARGLLVANADFNQKRYSRASSALVRDNDTLNMLLGLRARVMPKTTFLVDYEISDTNYDGTSPDTKDNRLLAGITWENTAQTTGKLRLGQGKRQTDSAKDINKFTWDLGMVWKPLVLDAINVSAGARTSDASFPYSSVENTNYSASWTHDWLDRVNTVVSLGASTDDYDIAPGVVASARSDDVTTYGVAVNYQMRRWLILNAAINSSDKDSSAAGFSNKRNVMSIGAQVSL
ncbi:outer membrane beta-barrel protein [uncultured Acinetobacter sp.]|uniref:outer membrane beta-barrel protein n=1 Tax=uncultured Acinetobacter sp. TaxID=165433 RepID=UPI00261F4644|nr:outer membrane beta-barrel protein [uncultured Acinetobacter sp.]